MISEGFPYTWKTQIQTCIIIIFFTVRNHKIYKHIHFNSVLFANLLEEEAFFKPVSVVATLTTLR